MVDCCAIFNGPHGTALRSYSNEVLVNGEPASAQWLQSGDEIQLPCSTKLAVRATSQYRPFEVKSSVAVAEPTTVPVEVKSERLNAIFGGDDKEEEVFHSPFSDDLSNTEEQSTFPAAVESPLSDEPADATPQPSLESRMSAIFDAPIGNQTSEQTEESNIPVENTVEDSASAEPTPEVAQSNELESVMQRLGVLSNPVPVDADPAAEATSFAEPVVPQPQPEEAFPTLVQEPEAQPAQPVPVEPTSLPQPSSISQQLESVFETSNADTPAVPVAIDSPVSSFEEVDAPTPVEQVPAESVMPAAQEPVVTVAEPVQVAAENSAVFEDPSQPAPEPSVQESIAAADPLSELPSDLRNQLNDLVSSLELNPKSTEPQSHVEVESATDSQQAFSPTEESTDAEMAAPSSEQPGLPSNADAFLESLRPTAEPENVTPTAEENVIPEPVETVEPEPVQPTSVADILGSMGMAIPGMDEPETQQPEPASFAAEVPVEPTPPASAPEPLAAPQPVAATGGAEDDIQAYMDKLLNRSAPVVERPTEQEVEAAAAAEATAREPAKVLSPEEFVPTHKAARHESFNDLREIANSSSRSAIRVSTSKARTESIIVKSSLFLLSFAGAILSYQLQMAIPAIAFVGAAFATSYLFYQDYKRREAELGAARAKLKQAR